jgi:uncharacterized membrane protein YdbT with pleckstrin-like domain
MDGFSKFHFKDLGQNEEIIRVLHRNWFYLLQQFVLMFVVVLIFMTGLFYAPIFFPQMFGIEFKPVVSFMENFFVLAVWIYGFLIWIDYYYDVWIITSQRIVNIEQKGMFTRKVSELRYSKIQDVTTEVVGFLPTVINYGDVLIQTAGEEENFVFRTISDPYKIKSIIVDLQKKHEGEVTEQLGEMIKEKIGA